MIKLNDLTIDFNHTIKPRISLELQVSYSTS